MHTTLIFLTLLNSILHSIKPQFQTDFCSIDCADGRDSYVHTVCKRSYECGPEVACEEIPPDQVFRDYMVRSHNELRNFIANGSNIQTYNHYRNPGAKNMNAVSYDLELEYVAKCWINTCVTGQHDECRDVSRFSVGQNIYWGQRSDINEVMPRESISLWFDEIQDMTDIEWIDSYPGIAGFPNDNKQRGHFTQVIWAETKYIGCARTRSKRDKTQATLICNYGTGGNIVDLPVYHLAENEGDIGSECEVRNSQFKALCGEVVSSPNGGDVSQTKTGDSGAIACKSSTQTHNTEDATQQISTPPIPPPKVGVPPTPDVPEDASKRKPQEPDCSNEAGLTDKEKQFCDWLERHNAKYRGRSCSLHGFTIHSFLIISIVLFSS